MPSNEGGMITPTTKILVIGGSYAGLAATVSLLDVCSGKRCRFAGDTEAEQTAGKAIPVEIDIVDERDGYFHLIGSPLAFVSEQYASKAWTTFDNIPALQHPAVRFTRGTVKALDTKTKSATISPYHTDASLGSNLDYDQTYDFVVVSCGLKRKKPAAPVSLERTTYLSETSQLCRAGRTAKNGVVVIGGGAVGIEMAAELKLVEPSQKVTLIHSRTKLLSSESLPDDFKDCALSLLQEAGVHVILGQRVQYSYIEGENGNKEYQLILGDGSKMMAGHVINAVSSFSPITSFIPRIALDQEGYIKIHPSLSFNSGIPNAKYHFAAGDIARWSGIKRCGAAMHQGHCAGINIYHQILQDIHGITPKFLELEEVPPMMGLAVGKQAVTYVEAEGVKSGEDRMALYFGDDLGFDICWNYMQLGKRTTS